MAVCNFPVYSSLLLPTANIAVSSAKVATMLFSSFGRSLVCSRYRTVGRNECTDFASYLVHIQLTAAERAVLNLSTAVWGRPEIEGRVLCYMYGIGFTC